MRKNIRLMLIIAGVVAAGALFWFLQNSDRLGIFADQVGSTTAKVEISGKDALSQGQLQDVVVTEDGFVQLAPAQ